ncbi:MAG: glucosaminidase domain-containing protein, partial [Chitinophagaceae bacterium]
MNAVKQYVDEYGPYAMQSEKDTGISALFSLAQSALETGWGRQVKGNNMFGIKATPPSYTGNIP